MAASTGAETGADALVRFARLASEAGTGTAILPLLADTLVEVVGADAVGVLEIESSGRATFVRSRHLPRELSDLVIDPDMIGEELGRHLLAACGGRFAHTRLRPLVSGGGLFGSVVMFFAAVPMESNLSDGLVDLAAIALDHAAKVHRLIESQAELRASQELLVRAEKLRALGQMAAGVAHDLKNILSPLSLHLQIATRSADRARPVELKESLLEMKRLLARGVETIDRLRDYSRQAPESRVDQLDLNQLAREACEIAKSRIASRSGPAIRIVQDLGSPPATAGRGPEILSAVVNLIVNAIDALAEAGGHVTLRTGASSKGSPWVQVSDDGPGMSPEVKQRVFEPFFTTKGESGTGLGLAMVYACMRRHGGAVTLESEVGRGATFTLSFPSATNAVP